MTLKRVFYGDGPQILNKCFGLLFVVFIVFSVACVVRSFSQIHRDPKDDGTPAIAPVWLNDTDDGKIDHGPLCDEFTTGVTEHKDRVSVHVEQSLTDEERAMVQEVVTLWNMFFDDWNTRKSDRRRRRFDELATYLVKAVRYYQEGRGTSGLRLPRHPNTHLVPAQIITKESSVTPGVLGKRGEIGLMQLMPMRGRRIFEYPLREVKDSPELNIQLGVRRLALAIKECGCNVDRWRNWKWLGPLSVYAAGGKNGKRKNGRCKVLGLARARLRKVIEYRNRMQATQKKYIIAEKGAQHEDRTGSGK